MQPCWPYVYIHVYPDPFSLLDERELGTRLYSVKAKLTLTNVSIVLQGLEAPRQLIDNRGSFKNYRVAFAGAKPPCIPYM